MLILIVTGNFKGFGLYWCQRL